MSLLYFWRLSTWVCVFGPGKAWGGERKGPFLLPLRSAQSLGVMGWARFSHSKRVIWGLPMGCRGGWRAAADPRCLPALPPSLAFHPEERNNTFICLHIGFPRKSLCEAGLTRSLSSASTSVGQQAGSVRAPTHLYPNTQRTEVRWSGGPTTLCPTSGNSFLFSLRPCLCSPPFHV